MSARVRKHPYSGHKGITRDFLKIVDDMTYGGLGHRQVFEAFLEMSFCAFAGRVLRGSEREAAFEARYMAQVGKLEAAQISRMPRLMALASIAMDVDAGDFLGTISGELGVLNEATGQFFTPFDISLMMAQMMLGDVNDKIAERGFITVHEPASGAGGMLLAVAQVLQHRGYDPSQTLYVQATDISETAFKMTYVQLALRGIPAVVVHGDSLSLEVWEKLPTWALIPFMQRHGARFTDWVRGDQPRLSDAAE